jgi:iron complex outermembrane receptor protein
MTTATKLRSRLHRGAALTALALAVGVAAPAFAQEKRRSPWTT